MTLFDFINDCGLMFMGLESLRGRGAHVRGKLYI